MNTNTPCSYAVMGENKIRMKSSSAGAFTLLAEKILEKGGYVCGASYNDNWLVEHIIIDNKNDLNRLKKSKYLQSKIGKCYKKIEQLLISDKIVLFSGTPCQVYGLKSYLMKDYDNLLTVDLICHGVPSPKVFEAFLTSLSDKESIESIDFREKEVFGWTTSTVIKFNDKKTYRKLAKDCFYTSAFQKSLFLNKPCSNCNFSKIPRSGDITLGDFWGISKYDKNLNDGLGTGVAVINNSKGENYLSEIKNEFKLIKEIPIDFTVNVSNPNLNGNFAKHKNRDIFFKYFKIGTPIKDAVILSLYYQDLVNIPKFMDKSVYYKLMYKFYRIIGNFVPKKLRHKYSEKKKIYKLGIDLIMNKNVL